MKKPLRSLLAIALVILALAGTFGFFQVRATVNEPANLLAMWPKSGNQLRITSVRVFDSVSGQLRPAGAVDIRDGRIAAIYWRGEDIPANGATTLPGNGRVLVPGLTDFHVHLGASDGRPPWDLDGLSMISVAGQREAFLYSGITSVVEGSPNALEALDEGEAPSPEVYTASRMITAKEGHPVPMYREFVPWPMTNLVIDEQVLPIRSAERNHGDLEALVNGSEHHVKVVFDGAIPWQSPHLSEQDLRSIVGLAHDAGKPVYVHIGSAEDAVMAARAGADVLMHPPYVDQLDDSDLAVLRESGVHVVTTAQIWEWLGRGLAKQPPLTPLEHKLASPALLASWDKDWHAATASYHSTTFSPDYLARLPGFSANQEENIKRLYQAGIPLIAGTDFGIPGLAPGASLIRELELLQSYGVAPADLLRMATSVPGQLLSGNESGMGVIQPGSPADLLLINADPTRDIAMLENLDFVIHDGVVYQRSR